MSGKKLFCLSSLLILPFFYVLFYCARLVMRGQPMEEALKWEGLLLLVTLILSQSTLGTGRTTVLQGVVHLMLFATFLFLAMVP